nr:SUMF1/EgtB/PvdO family nonheme iron enzyme [Rhizobium ecuadorense]
MRTREETAVTSKCSEDHMDECRVTVGEFREFVRRTAYITDCEKHDSGWIFVKGKWQKKYDASWDNPYIDQEEQDPVVLVSWHDAVMFANWKSARDGLTQAYSFMKTHDDCIVGVDPSAAGYRLPTEREWEAANCDSAVALVRPVTPSKQRFNQSGQGFPGARWSQGGAAAERLEWCWDPGEPAASGGGGNHADSGFTEARICRGDSVVGPDGRLEVSRGTCDPFSAATTLGFRLIRGT